MSYLEKILIVEDDVSIHNVIEKLLKKENYTTYNAYSGTEALLLLEKEKFDLILLDLMLPAISGEEIIEKVSDTPIIVLSAKISSDDKVNCLMAGANDYITKPFDAKELVARIQAVIRRSKGHSESTIKIGRMSINLQSRRVEIDGKVLHLTRKEYAILELLCLRRGATLTKDMFLNHLYGGIDEPELKIIDVFVCKLRKKLMDAMDGECYIETIWGRGYTLKDVPEEKSSISKIENSGSFEEYSRMQQRTAV